MNDFSVPMALADFIPVLFFTLAAVSLQRQLYNKMSKGAFALFAAGTIDIIAAGGLKALWKLLYALGVCNFEALDSLFFPLQSIGFLLAGLGLVAMMCHRQGNAAALAVVPPVFSGTFLFVGLMVGGLGMIDTVLCLLAAKLGRKRLIPIFVFSFFCSLCMGYLSSRDFAEASMNWIAEGVNILGQGSLFLGTLALKKNGLEKLPLHKENA